MSSFKFLLSTRGFSKNGFVHKLWHHLLTTRDSGGIAATLVLFFWGGEGLIVSWWLMRLPGMSCWAVDTDKGSDVALVKS